MQPAESPGEKATGTARSSLIQRFRVPLGFAFAIIYIWFADPTPVTIPIGAAIAIPGLLLRLWTAGHLQKHCRLTRSGPYRWTRNPLYLGSFFIGLGLSIGSGRALLIVLFVILFFLIYHPVMRKEETELRNAYGAVYENYLRRVPFFWPVPGRPAFPSSGNFSVRRVILNREYRATLGFVAIIVFLLIRVS